MRGLCFFFSGVLLLLGCSQRKFIDEEVDAASDAIATKDSSMSMDGSFDASSDVMSMDAGAAFDFMVVRVGKNLDAGGDGAVLNTSAFPVFVEERTSTDGTVLRTIAMPTTDGGAFTLTGNGTTEGALATSADGKYVTVGGYGANPGTANLGTSSSATYKRVFGRIDKAGMLDATTRTNAFNTTPIRGVATDDGSGFWATGGVTGVVYAALGAATATTISTTVTNNRSVAVFGNQLYASTSIGAYRVYSIGNGLPKTGTQVGSNLAGVTGNTPGSFALLDVDSMVTGVDALYVADERATPNGGVQKWTSNGTTWMLVTTFNDSLNAGCSNVTATKLGNEVHVICASLESPTRLVRYVDDGKNMMPSATVLATAQTGTAFRGVAISPQ